MQLSDIKLTPLLDTLKLEKISDAIYFSKKYSHYISNSRLGLLNPRQDGSPEKFFEGFKQGGFNQSFALGSAVHEIVLQNEYFEIAPDLNKPSAKLGAMADYLYPIFLQGEVTMDAVIEASDNVEYYKGKINKDKYDNVIKSCTPYWEARQNSEFDLGSKEIIYLDTKSREIALSCIESLNNNKAVQELLHPQGILEEPIVENENAILLDVKAECPNGKTFILHLKSKLDNFTLDLENNILTVNDVKTIGKIVSAIDDNIVRYRYSREFAMYIYLLKLCAEKFYGMKNPKIRANYLVVSTIPNFYSKVRPVKYQEIQEGFHEFKTLLRYSAYLIGYKNYTLDEPTSKYQF